MATTAMQLLDAIAEQIRGALENADVDVQVEPRMVAIPSTVCVDMYPGAPAARDPETAGFGDIGGGHFLTVRARINTPDSYAAQDVLLRMMQDDGDMSLAAALWEDITLGDVAAQVDVQNITGYTLYPLPDGTPLLGFQLDLLVIAGLE